MIAAGEVPVISNWYTFKRMAYTGVRSLIFWGVLLWCVLASTILTPAILLYVAAHLLITGTFAFLFCKGQYQMEAQSKAILERDK